jgi:hypothetical protein
MKPIRAQAAFTRRDLIVVIAVVTFLSLFIMTPASQRARQKVERISCVNNLDQIGTAYRIWANDNGGLFPFNMTNASSGSTEISHGDDGRWVWRNFELMAKQLGSEPQILTCPADERKPATTLSNIANTNISYFVGDVGDGSNPQSLLGGDRNLGPGTIPASDYGFSLSDGKGSNVIISGPICWTLKMHSRENRDTCGNILLADGSAQQVTSLGLNKDWLPHAQPISPTNSGNLTRGIRLLFP